MDQVQMGENVESRWMFQDKDIHFMIFSGAIDLHFRLNENIHVKHLSTNQSLRIPSGVPFMLKTYEIGGSILLISILQQK
jgi:mannose-6-phosphate isomerase-like protein (cupin superfamily)